MSNQTYPKELEELMARLEKAKRFFSSPKGGGLWLVAGLLLLWVLAGITTIKPHEQAVMLVFGKHVRSAGPGINWNWARPVGQTFKVPVTRVQKLEIGFETIDEGPPARYRHIPQESLMLTGDENIVSLEFIVQYKVSDPERFLFSLRNQRNTIKAASEAAMREVVGMTDITAALTQGKSEIQASAELLIQNYMDRYNAGISIETVKLQDVNPPEDVIDAFKDVISAQQDKERLINEAKGYENNVIPKARGAAAQMINEAEAYRSARVTEAQGEASRFLALLKEYRKGKDVTRTRLYLEAMQEILPNFDITVVDDHVASQALPHFSLNGAAGKSSAKK